MNFDKTLRPFVVLYKRKPTPSMPIQPPEEITDLVENVDENGFELPVTDVGWASLYGPGSFSPTGATTPRLEPGVYFAMSGDKGPFLYRHHLVTDELIEMPDEREVALREQVAKFMKAGHLYRKYGYAHRRGILLHGPAGSGKTCLLQSFVKKHVAHGGLVIYFKAHPSHCASLITSITKMQPDTMIIAIIEEIEQYIDQYNEANLLQVLDGEDSMRNTLVISTTNYPERLDRRVINRPRRFDHIQYVGMPSAAVRAVYFLKKLGIEKAELVEWVTASEDFSFAAMAELVISVKCLERPLEEAAADLKKMMEATPKSEDWGAAIKSTKMEKVKAYSGTVKDIIDACMEQLEAKNTPPTPAPMPTHPFVAGIMQQLEAGNPPATEGCPS